MTRWLKLRASEWILLGFFGYIVFISRLFFRQAIRIGVPGGIVVGVFVLFASLSRLERTRWEFAISRARDWIPIGLTYLAFREMELFASPAYDLHLEQACIRLDQLVLGTWHLRSAIESWGAFLPSGLEICYFLVYGVPAYCVWLLYSTHRRADCDRFYVFYLLGTLTAYCLFPYFPSEPPRFAFPNVYAPQIHTALHSLNVSVLKSGTIHTAVFPSAHVSSVFSAAWALFALFPKRTRYAWIAVAYAAAVSIATVYGRYHYVADVLGGFAVSLIPAALAVYQISFSPVAHDARRRDHARVATEST